jgi:ribulose-5-phosphate 4-epimerase/fuculose-1-phosphate aldolase
MNVKIVGGNFGLYPKTSGVITKLASFFENPSVVNGGSIASLPQRLDNFDLVVWMPNIDNEEAKHYPLKRNGTVLICSKIMREGYKHIDALSRIFSMHGNAVIEIDTVCEKYFMFTFIDALGNIWYQGSSLEKLVYSIFDFYDFTKSAVRIPTRKSGPWNKDCTVLDSAQEDELNKLLEINSALQSQIMKQCGTRFFGNVSTRCQQLFPSMRSDTIFVSPRNSDKESLEAKDMVKCRFDCDDADRSTFVSFFNGDKPSIDAAIQLQVYEIKTKVNYMIHGHATLVNKKYSFWTGITENYRLCGDFREAYEILIATHGVDHGILTLKNHGFLVFAENLDQISEVIKEAEFEMDVTRILS